MYVGIFLGMVPLLGGWGTLNWTTVWADKAGGEQFPDLKADISIWRSSGAALGSLLGGWLASRFGRRGTYFAISLLSLLCSGYIFWTMTPLDKKGHETRIRIRAVEFDAKIDDAVFTKRNLTKRR